MSFITAGIAKGLEMVGDAADAAADMVSGAATKPMRDAKAALEEMESSLTSSLDQVNRAKDLMEVPMDAADAAKDQFKNLTSGIAGILNGDGTSLLPAGGNCFAKCIAKCYINGVKGKLNKFSKDVEKVATDIMESPKAAVAGLESLKESTKHVVMAFACIEGVLKETVTKVEGLMKDPTQAATLDQDLLELDNKLKDQIRGARSAIEKLIGALAAKPPEVITTVQDLTKRIDLFTMKAPKKITSAFKPPCCCCCASGKAGEAQQTLENTLDTVAKAVSLQPISDGLQTMKDSLDLITFDSATGALSTVEAQYMQIMAPVKEAASKMAGMRAAASGEDPPPEA